MSDLLLDTCAVIWAGRDDALGDDCVEAMQTRKCWVSAYTAWELGLLVSRARLRLTLPVLEWFETFLHRSQFDCCALSPDILVESCFLPGKPPPDPADRIIIASARLRNLTIVTRDRRILGYAHEGYVSALPC